MAAPSAARTVAPAAHASVLTIAAWGARQAGAVLARRGCAAGRTPGHATRHRLRRRRDGQAPRGRVRDRDGGGPVHALRACCHARGLVLAHAPSAQGASTVAAELTVAPALRAPVDWRGRVLTGDARHGRRATGQHVLAAGGDDLLLVTATPPARSLLRRAGIRPITARLRDHRRHPEAAVALLCGTQPPDA